MTNYIQKAEDEFYVKHVDAEGIKESLEQHPSGQALFNRSAIKQAHSAFKWLNITGRILQIYSNQIKSNF